MTFATLNHRARAERCGHSTDKANLSCISHQRGCLTPGITGAHTTTEPHKFSTTVPLTRVRFIPLLVRFDVERSVIPDTKQAKLLCRSHLVRLGPCCGDAYFAGVNFRSTVTPHSPLAFSTPLT